MNQDLEKLNRAYFEEYKRMLQKYGVSPEDTGEVEEDGSVSSDTEQEEEVEDPKQKQIDRSIKVYKKKDTQEQELTRRLAEQQQRLIDLLEAEHSRSQRKKKILEEEKAKTPSRTSPQKKGKGKDFSQQIFRWA